MFTTGMAEQVVVLVVAVMTIVVPIFVIASLVHAARHRPAPDPRATLADRLAKGEIAREEFDTAMRALGYGERPGSNEAPRVDSSD